MLFWCVANWKMHGSRAMVQTFAQECSIPDTVTAILCPPAPYLETAQQAISGTALKLGAQTCHTAEHGAFTGDIAAPMLTEFGCDYVILGHSERRRYHGETDERIAKQMTQAFHHNLTPIVCVGESLEEREEGKTKQVIQASLKALLPTWQSAHGKSLLIAYEPVWAIGSGLTPSIAQITEIHRFIKNAMAVPVLYGGSVKPGNAAELAAIPEVDGFLIGGASLHAADFSAIAKASVRD